MMSTGRPSDGARPRAPASDAPDASALQDHPSFASTLANGLGVLGCFSGAEPVLGNKDIADKLRLSRPTVSRLTFTLVELGYLRRERKTGKYMLGPAVLSLVYPLLSQLTIRQVAAAQMLELARMVNGAVSVGTRDRLQVVYVETAGVGNEATRPGVGSTRPMLRTAMGRALIHAHPAAERASLEQRLQQEMPQEWDRYAPGLSHSCAEIDERGFCTVVGEWRPTLAAVAVPVKAQLHGLHLAFSVTVPTYSDEARQLGDSLGPRLVELVRRVEASLGL